MKKVLVLEDESSIRSFIVINLRRAGYDVIEAETGEDALERLKENPDTRVALLDIMLPGIDGFEVCRRIRATNTRIGIIMLTARSQEMDKVTGLMTGADDYVTKPFSPVVLAARVRTLLKRTGVGVREVTTIGDLEIDEIRRRVTVAGAPCELTPKEYELLIYFKNNRSIALSREAILNAVWGYDYFGDLRTVDTHIKKLRAKLGPCGAMIDTVRGYGYRFEG